MAYQMAIILHVGSLSEPSLIEYLFRVVLHLVALGGLALLIRLVTSYGSGVRFR